MKSHRFLVLLASVSALANMVFVSHVPGQSSDKSSRSREFLDRLDTNKNGTLEPNEVPDFARRFVEKAAEKKGWKLSDPLPIKDLASAMEGDSENRKSEERRKSERNSVATPQAPGFESAPPAETAPGFQTPLLSAGVALDDYYEERVRDQVYKEILPKYDRNKDGILLIGDETRDGRWTPELKESDTNGDGRLDKAELFERYAKKFNLPRSLTPLRKPAVVQPVATEKTSSSSSESKAAGPQTDKVREYAQGLLNRYDRNKSGYLERDEWQEMKSEYQAADINKDNVITLDELTAKLAGYATNTSSGTSSNTPSTATASSASASGATSTTNRRWWQSNSSNSNNKPAEKKSYRFLSPTERLPKGLPDWFARYDTNADGQVMMAEYASSWTDTLAAEFQKHDLNGDGVITPEECLAATKTVKK